MVSRAWKVGGAIVLAASCAGAVAVPRVARARVTQAIDERCRRVLESDCTIGDVRLAIDGVLIRDLSIRAKGGRYTARVHRVGVRLGWLGLLLGSSQKIDVEVDGVDVRGRATLAELLADARSQREADRSSPRRSRLRLRGLHVAGVNANLTVTDMAGHPLEVKLRQAGFDWARDAPGTTARWNDLSVERPGLRSHSGACTVLDGLDTATTLDCREFEADVDSARLREFRALAGQSLETIRGTAASGEAPVTEAEVPGMSGRQMQVRFRDGRVRVLHGDDLIADLTPAGVSAIVESGSLREGSFQLGGEDSRQPSLSLSFNRMREPWQVDLEAAALPLRELAPWVPAVPWHGTGEGRAHARVHVEPAEAPERVEVSGDVYVENFGLQHPGLAHEPVDGLSLSLDGRATLDFGRRRLSTPGLNWQVNGIPVSMAGWVERDAEHTSMDVALRVPPMSCEGAMRALPRPVTGVAMNLGLTGTVGGDARIALDTRRLSATAFDYNVQDGCAVTQAGWGLSVRRFAEPFVQRVLEPGGTMRAFVTGPGAPAWVPVEHIPPNLLNAVVSREDGGFYRHRGFSPGEIRGALVRNVSEGRFAYGASTISMQLVKNVFLAREKTLVRKLQEVVLTWWIEQSLDKQSILELYLNVVEFGPGIYGVGPASRFFFGREPRDLTPLQAVYLATLLPAPVPRFAIFQRGAASPDTVARLRAIARAMAATGLMSSADAEAAQHETFAFRPRNAPVPGPQTLTVDTNTTDEAARVLAERSAVAVRETPAGDGASATDTAGEPAPAPSPGPQPEAPAE